MQDSLPEPLPHHSRLLKAVRHKHGWSQLRLAHELGVSVRTIKRWEKGQDTGRDPHPSWLKLFSDLFQQG